MREIRQFTQLILTNPKGWMRVQLAWVYSNVLLFVLGLIFWGFVALYRG